MKKLTYLWIFLILLYFLPAFVQPNFSKDDRIQSITLDFPRILSGDEPHYLAAAYSLSKDFDLKLNNNYQNAFEGECDLGYNFKNKKTPGHLRFILNGKDFYSILFEDSMLKPQFKNIDLNLFDHLPFHPSGLPLFVSIFFWPLKDSCLLEIGVVILSVTLSLIGLFCLYKVLLYYKKDTKAAFLITSLIALGTTMWFYSKTFFTGPYITAFLLIAYYLFIVRKQIILPAIFFGIGMTMKYSFVVFPAVFCLFLLYKRRISDLFKFGIVIFIFGFLLMFFNYSLYSHVFSQAYTYNNIFEGLFGILFSPTKGLLFFMPFLAFAILGVKKFYRSFRNEALLTMALILSHYIFFASFVGWGGGALSSRNMTPVLPLLGIVLYFWYINNKNKILKYLFYALAIISIIINFQTAFFHFIFWGDKPPWQLLYLAYFKFERVLEIFIR